MRRTSTNLCTLIALIAAPSCIPDGPEASQPSHSIEPGSTVLIASELSERQSIPLQACQRFESFLRLKKVLTEEDPASKPWTPEWQQHGFHAHLAKSGQASVSWAEGYSAWDDAADVPEQRAWWSCLLPDSFTKDLQVLSVAASAHWETGVAEVQLIGESPKREFLVAIDIASRRALARSLRSWSDGDCALERSCSVDPSTGSLSAGPWTRPVAPACAASIHDRTSEDERAVGVWPFDRASGPDWN